MPSRIESLLPLWEEKAHSFSERFSGFSLFVSGGLDSTVLSHIFCGSIKIQNFSDTELVHLNFMLRGEESHEDERFVSDLADTLGVRVRLLQASDILEGPPIGTSPQLWARNVRRSVVESARSENRLSITAHHANDVIETIIFRLARGSTAGNLVGMREFNDVTWRPFLSLSRKELDFFAQEKSVTHRVDSSNAKLEYSRNRIRHLLVPELNKLFPSIEPRIHACFRDAHDVESELQRRLLAERKQNTNEQGVDEGWIKQFAEGTSIMVIGDMIKEAADSSIQIRRDHLITILNHIGVSNHPWSMHLPANLMWISKRGRGSVVLRHSDDHGND
jgi:tRNA(Ile)-lysidine synthetase-like protein